MPHAKSSRRQYDAFREQCRSGKLDEAVDGQGGARANRSRRREYLRDYFRWLWPHRYAVAGIFVLALLGAGLEMIEPLFMRFITDRVLLSTGLGAASRSRSSRGPC